MFTGEGNTASSIRFFLLFGTFYCLAVSGLWAQNSGDDGGKLYRERIRPLLAKNCLVCHGENVKQAGLDLSTRESLLRGGDDGPVIVPGDPQSSLLFKLVTHERQPGMPYQGKKLAEEDLASLSAWIRAGVPFDTAVNPRTAFTARETHWAFRPPKRSPLPVVKNSGWVLNPVDAFILAEADKKGLKPVEDADPRTLIRRVYLDLTGLPPAPAEIQAFLADRSKGAYERVVDRLLASPRYGERWGRHWMDIWRYSDWYGNRKIQDLRASQRHIWRWRDWIVESLNADKGYDRMIMEMLAGDELAPDDPKVLAATGYLARTYFMVNRNTWLQDTVEYTAMSFLGLTMRCARCHSHKYDPIPQTDYYRLRAFFEPYTVRIDCVPGETDTLKDGLVRAYDANPATPTYRFVRGNEQNPDTANPLSPGVPGLFGKADLKIQPVPLPLSDYYPDSRNFVQKDLVAGATADIATAEAELKKARDQLAKGSSVTETSGSGSAAAGTAGAAAVKNLDLEERLAQKRLDAARAYLDGLKARIAAENASRAAGASDAERLAAEAGKLDRKARTLKAEERLMRAQMDLAAVKDQDDKESNKRRASAQKEVKAALEDLTQPDGPFTPIGNVYPMTSTGRRLALARWIASGDNPLTARVAVNHMWARHFGTPLVPIVWNFGKSGKPPTHPELLDWLATELVAKGWSMKAVHRLMVTSHTYRLASVSENSAASNRAIDPDNRYLWHMNPRRMEAEVVRDSLLYVSGKLDSTMGGPELDESRGEDTFRRSIYYRDAQGYQVDFLKVFDAPSPIECFQRNASVVPQQSLALANSRLALTASWDLARQISARIGESNSRKRQFVLDAFESVLGRPPVTAELVASLKFLDEQAALYRDNSNLKLIGPEPAKKGEPVAPDLRAGQNLVHALLNHNDFLTIR